MAQMRDYSLEASAVVAARSTTGQALAIRYDARSNTIIFAEDDWFADGFRSSGVPERSEVRQRLGASVVRLKARRRA